MKKIVLLFGVIIVIVITLFITNGAMLVRDLWHPSVTPSPSIISPSPTPTTVSSRPEPTIPGPDIQVTLPHSGDNVRLPIIVKGKARVFENQFNYEVQDSAGSIITSGTVYANSLDAGQFGSFTITISRLPASTSGSLMLDIFDYSAKDGSKIDEVKVPIFLVR